MTSEQLKNALLTCRPVVWKGAMSYERATGVVDAIIYTRDGDFSGKIRVSARLSDNYGRQITVLAKDLSFMEANNEQ